MKLLSLFSGVGAFETALEYLGIDYELVNYCEVDKFASKAYSLMHRAGTNLNLGDITKVDEKTLPKDIDLVTYGFPCQDISIVGEMRGLKGERSGLVFDALRIINETKPKYAICENVKNLTGKRFKNEFEYILKCLENCGYNNYWKVLNAKDYGIPQNRERVFIISIRKDIDKGNFQFPEPIKLNKCLKDMLEDNVDEKYYLSERLLNFFRENSKKNQEKGNGFRFLPFDEVELRERVSRTITTRAGSRMDDNFITVKQIGNVFQSKTRENPNAGRVYDKEGLCPCLNTMQGGYLQPSITEQEIKGERVRRLTPRECFRLMGFEDEYFDILEDYFSDTQLYKMAGNSIVVNVLMAIFKELFKDEY